MSISLYCFLLFQGQKALNHLLFLQREKRSRLRSLVPTTTVIDTGNQQGNRCHHRPLPTQLWPARDLGIKVRFGLGPDHFASVLIQHTHGHWLLCQASAGNGRAEAPACLRDVKPRGWKKTIMDKQVAAAVNTEAASSGMWRVGTASVKSSRAGRGGTKQSFSELTQMFCQQPAWG